MLRRQKNQAQLNELLIDGNITKDDQEIEAHVKSFYQDLYNQKRPAQDQNLITEMVSKLPTLDDQEADRALQTITVLD